MLAWLLPLFGFLTKLVNPVSKIVDSITNEKIQQANAVTEQDRIASGERISALQSKRDVLIAEAGSGWNTIGRFILMFPFAIIVWQYIVWDKIACKWFTAAELVGPTCSTDPLGGELSYLLYVVYGFYFLNEIAKVVKR